ncbi:Hypothetical predicted protein [Olea europaea subsp. europaea]|uniref:Uncharacterized protein n=1 Tax=Olea europaea subsp. europaea TaxID=158383 RepID=A0A8S0UJL1_OLEEU|nr:Hypothetical predicted protein [Olea europaea subsp. europaea]
MDARVRFLVRSFVRSFVRSLIHGPVRQTGDRAIRRARARPMTHKAPPAALIATRAPWGKSSHICEPEMLKSRNRESRSLGRPPDGPTRVMSSCQPLGVINPRRQRPRSALVPSLRAKFALVVFPSPPPPPPPPRRENNERVRAGPNRRRPMIDLLAPREGRQRKTAAAAAGPLKATPSDVEHCEPARENNRPLGEVTIWRARANRYPPPVQPDDFQGSLICVCVFALIPRAQAGAPRPSQAGAQKSLTRAVRDLLARFRARAVRAQHSGRVVAARSLSSRRGLRESQIRSAGIFRRPLIISRGKWSCARGQLRKSPAARLAMMMNSTRRRTRDRRRRHSALGLSKSVTLGRAARVVLARRGESRERARWDSVRVGEGA